MTMNCCGECDGVVSDAAAVCPHCGAPFRGPSSRRFAWAVLALLLIVGVFAFSLLSGSGGGMMLGQLLLLAIIGATLLFWFVGSR
jgi:uncharacterized paraquat-inducible protein A